MSVAGVASIRLVPRSQQSSRRLTRSGRWVVFVLTIAIASIMVAPSAADAATSCEKITDSFSDPHQQANSDFAVIEKALDVAAGPVKLAGDCEGTDEVSVDDGIVVEVTRPDGSQATFDHDFSGGCLGVITPAGPFDLTSLFVPGANSVRVRFRDLCEQGGSGSSDVYLVYTQAEAAPGPTPTGQPLGKEQIRLSARPVSVAKGKKTKLTATVNLGKECASRLVRFQRKKKKAWSNLGKAVKPGKGCRVTKRVRMTSRTVFRAILVNAADKRTLARSSTVVVGLR